MIKIHQRGRLIKVTSAEEERTITLYCQSAVLARRRKTALVTAVKTAHRIVTGRESEVRKMKTLATWLINTVCDADKSNVSAITKFLRRNISVGMMVKLDSLTK